MREQDVDLWVCACAGLDVSTGWCVCALLSPPVPAPSQAECVEHGGERNARDETRAWAAAAANQTRHAGRHYHGKTKNQVYQQIQYAGRASSCKQPGRDHGDNRGACQAKTTPRARRFTHVRFETATSPCVFFHPPGGCLVLHTHTKDLIPLHILVRHNRKHVIFPFSNTVSLRSYVFSFPFFSLYSRPTLALSYHFFLPDILTWKAAFVCFMRVSMVHMYVCI